MLHWSVEGKGAEVRVTSPDGDVYPFMIASAATLQLTLSAMPSWQKGEAPADAAVKIDAALGAASRWTQDTFGAPHAQAGHSQEP